MEMKDLVTLSDDKEYVVVSKVMYENKVYYYLIEKTNFSNIKFLLENGEELVSVRDADLLTKLLPLFIKTTEAITTTEDLEIMKKYIEENRPE